MPKELPPLPSHAQIKQDLLYEKNEKGRKIAQFVKEQPKKSRGNYLIKACIHFSALGYSQKDIAKHLELSVGRVSAIMKSKSCQEEISRLQDEFFDAEKVFKMILPEAVKIMRREMNSSRNKSSDRIAAASQFMDRALGKAKQQVEVQGSAIKDLLLAIDKSKNPSDSLIAPIDAEFTQLSDKKESEEKIKDPMDDWIDKNL